MPPLCHSVDKRFGAQGFRVMEDKMEAAILGCIYIYIHIFVFFFFFFFFFFFLFILFFFNRDNGQEHGNYYLGFTDLGSGMRVRLCMLICAAAEDR